MAHKAIVDFAADLGKKSLHSIVATELFVNDEMQQKTLWIMRRFWLN